MNKLLVVAVLGTAIGAAAAQAQTQKQAPNLADRTVTMLIASGPGGGFDLWGRMVARHIGKHLPGKPNVVPQNMPGAGGFVAANYLYNVAPKDGTAMAIMPAGTPLGPIMGASGARFDATRFNWVGTPATETPTCIAFNSARVRVKTVADLYQHELVVGSTGPGAGPHTWPKAMAALLGLKFKVVAGFPSTANIFLAIERGEIDGICTILDTIVGQRPDWIASGKVTMILHGGGAQRPLLKGIPFAGDLAKTAEQKSAIEFLFASTNFGRPILAPPDMDADRVTMLQNAFVATMKDADFVADVAKQKLDVEYQDGATLAALIKKVYATPKPIVDKVSELIK
jgi:tripartite-type tricarboxylate transporter receptor subunit TctC